MLVPLLGITLEPRCMVLVLRVSEVFLCLELEPEAQMCIYFLPFFLL